MAAAEIELGADAPGERHRNLQLLRLELQRQRCLDPALVAWVGLDQARDWCLYGGEDFELVLCLPAAIAQALQPHLGPGSAVVGLVTEDRAVILTHPDHPGQPPIVLSLKAGFQHF